MEDLSTLASSVGAPDLMSKVEEDLQRLGYEEVNGRVEHLCKRQYTRRVIVDSMDSVCEPQPSVVITWRC